MPLHILNSRWYYRQVWLFLQTSNKKKNEQKSGHGNGIRYLCTSRHQCINRFATLSALCQILLWSSFTPVNNHIYATCHRERKKKKMKWLKRKQPKKMISPIIICWLWIVNISDFRLGELVSMAGGFWCRTNANKSQPFIDSNLFETN